MKADKPPRFLERGFGVAAAAWFLVASAAAAEIQIGLEYMLPGHAKLFSSLGVPAAKPLPENFSWGKMQSASNQPLDFSVLDQHVLDCQNSNFTEIVLGLRSMNDWASKAILFNPVPKPEFESAFTNWVQSIVERYDGDGQSDLPGLRFPVRLYEIGVEFSSYEPEPVADYLHLLDLARRAIKTASSNAQVLHAAFLTTTAFRNHPQPTQYEAAFAAMDPRIAWHSLSDIRAILDRPDLFDLLNLHALGEPAEIEDMVAWLKWETGQRGYTKSIMISDTGIEPFIAWGPADTTNGTPDQLGLVIPPATKQDRPRLAAYFTKLLDSDPATVNWVRGFSASDMAKKIIIAAEQGVVLLNTAYTEDLELFKLKGFHAGTGNSAWGGMLRIEQPLFQPQPIVTARYPNSYAISQVQRHLRGYQIVRRVATADPSIRIYQMRKANARERWIAWLVPGRVILPEDPVPSVEADLALGEPGPVTIERLITSANGVPDTAEVAVPAGTLKWPVTPTPVFLFRTDRDADGLPDGWEQTHNLNSQFPSDATLDSDGDGHTNLQEYIAGTDPQDRQSLLRIEGIAWEPSVSAVSVRFTARSGRAYRLEQRPALSNAAWERLQDVPAASGDRPMELKVPATGAAAQFFRLVITESP